MLNRLNWIITSYLSCPLTWGVLAVSVLFTGIAVLVGPGGNQQHSIAPTPQFFSHWILNTATLQEARRRHEQAKIEQIDLGQLAATQQHDTGEDPTAPGAPDLSELLEEFPNLRSVNIGPFLDIQPTSRLRGRLARLDKLENLSLMLSPTRNGHDLAWLATIPRLRSLELVLLSRNPDLSALANLPHLESLTLRGEQSYQRCLPQVAALKHLRTLVIVPPPGTDRAPPAPATFAVLRSAPELRTFYFGNWQFGQQQNPATALQAVLPGLPVYPALVTSANGPQLGPVGLIIALLSAALAYQLAAQFHGSPSRVLPGFVPAQSMVAAGCWAAIVAASAWLLGQLGLSLTVGIAVAVAITAVLMVAEIAMLASHFRTRSVGSLQSLGLTLWCIPMPGMLLTAPWWFEIHRGATLACSAMLTAGCAGWIARRLRPGREAGQEVARSQGWPPFQLSSGWRSWIVQWHWRHGERRIERLRPGTIDRSSWQRIGRWRLGNMPRGLWLVWLLTLITMTSIVVAVSMFADSDSPFLSQFIVVFVLVSAPVGLFIPGIALTLGAWLWRLRSLPVESLRPGSDHFRRDLAAALALDLAPAALILACSGALGTNLDSQNHLHWAGVPASFAIFLVLGVAAAGAAALALVVRGWLVVCLLAAAFFVSLFSIGYLAVRHVSPTAPPSAAEFSSAVQSQLWVPILLTGLLACVAAWRWRTMELAEFSS